MLFRGNGNRLLVENGRRADRSTAVASAVNKHYALHSHRLTPRIGWTRDRRLHFHEGSFPLSPFNSFNPYFTIVDTGIVRPSLIMATAAEVGANNWEIRIKMD
jgi:hypothetical protein